MLNFCCQRFSNLSSKNSVVVQREASQLKPDAKDILSGVNPIYPSSVILICASQVWACLDEPSLPPECTGSAAEEGAETDAPLACYG